MCLPMSTSTWHSNHHKIPGAYMSGEHKSENINTKKSPLDKAIIQQNDSTVPCNTITPQEGIIPEPLQDCCLQSNAIPL